MPGPWGLIDGVEQVRDLDQVEVIEHQGTVRETAAACNRLYWGRGEYAGVIFSLGCTLGCSLVSGSQVGLIERCEIWYPAGWQWVRQHGLQHCRGYRDIF